MTTTTLTRETLEAGASTAPGDGPVVMLNLLRFNEQARYHEEGPGHSREDEPTHARRRTGGPIR